MGFLLVPWGAPASDVAAAYGKPFIERLTPDSSSVMIYKDAALGKPVLSLFYLDRAGGLVRGVSSIPYGPGSECETIMRQSEESILRIYPSLQPVEERARQDTTLAFCDAAAAGKANWTVSWVDPASGNSVQVALVPGERRVEITYQSGAFHPSPSTP